MSYFSALASFSLSTDEKKSSAIIWPEQANQAWVWSGTEIFRHSTKQSFKKLDQFSQIYGHTLLPNPEKKLSTGAGSKFYPASSKAFFYRNRRLLLLSGLPPSINFNFVFFLSWLESGVSQEGPPFANISSFSQQPEFPASTVEKVAGKDELLKKKNLLFCPDTLRQWQVWEVSKKNSWWHAARCLQRNISQTHLAFCGFFWIGFWPFLHFLSVPLFHLGYRVFSSMCWRGHKFCISFFGR